jgi:hypothetical protein
VRPDRAGGSIPAIHAYRPAALNVTPSDITAFAVEFSLFIIEQIVFDGEVRKT